MVFAMIHIPMTSFSVRETVKVIIHEEIRKFDKKKTATKELKSWYGFIKKNYLNDSASKPFDC